MSSTIGLDFSQLDEFNKEALSLINDKFPKEAKKFVSRAGNAFRADVKKGYRSQTKRKTGNLLRGVTRGRAYVYDGDSYQVRVYSKAPHAHLIERGHKLVYYGHPTEKLVPGKHIVGKSVLDFNDKFSDLAEKFVDDLLEGGWTS